MRYLLLITRAGRDESPTPAQDQATARACTAYGKAVTEAGIRVAGDALAPDETVSCVRVRADGERMVTDGPFAETGAVLGGYYVLDLPDLDAALDWAARCPGAHDGGTVEVRPIRSADLP